jgi:hypothetical protein
MVVSVSPYVIKIRWGLRSRIAAYGRISAVLELIGTERGDFLAGQIRDERLG